MPSYCILTNDFDLIYSFDQVCLFVKFLLVFDGAVVWLLLLSAWHVVGLFFVYEKKKRIL